MSMPRPRNQKGSLQIRTQGGVKKYVALYYGPDGRREFKTIGSVSRMKKSTAEAELAKLVAPINERAHDPLVSDFIDGVYLPFCRQNWKESTRDTTEQRLRTHVTADLGERRISELRRDLLQKYLRGKADEPNKRTKALNSHSLVAHLRWDLKHILDLAVADEIVRTNQAAQLSIPRTIKPVSTRTAAPKDVMTALAALGIKERLIVRLAVFVGLRPGEIFGLCWRHLSGDQASIEQRIYRGKLDTVKNQRPRIVAIPATAKRDLERWAELSFDLSPDAWIFPSDNRRAGNKDSVWRHAIEPTLRTFKLSWMNFQVMRRTWATTAAGAGIDPKVRADQLGHGVDVDVNVYTQVDFARKLAAVSEVERIMESFGDSELWPKA